ncbi:MAG: hypothetical protein LW688_06010 [Cryomorphaceae bacterium]|jgi:hypothetical protein|nr:hypothetical protein [Cryomorphaceae bacterium]
MATYCHELKHKIIYGEPFFILTREGINGGAIVSLDAVKKIEDSLKNEDNHATNNSGIDIHAAKSSYSHGDTYSWFDITKEDFLFSITEKTFKELFPNAHELLNR